MKAIDLGTVYRYFPLLAIREGHYHWLSPIGDAMVCGIGYNYHTMHRFSVHRNGVLPAGIEPCGKCLRKLEYDSPEYVRMTEYRRKIARRVARDAALELKLKARTTVDGKHRGVLGPTPAGSAVAAIRAARNRGGGPVA